MLLILDVTDDPGSLNENGAGTSTLSFPRRRESIKTADADWSPVVVMDPGLRRDDSAKLV
jgi:hypothetical protein